MARIAHGAGDRPWNDLVDAHRRDVEMGGYSLHTIDIGSGTPVLMIHGYGCSTYGWHENVPTLLDAGFRLVLVDQPGLGRSTFPADHVFSIESQTRCIVELADRLDLERFHVAGHSMGGGIGLRMALEDPDRILRLVTVAPACYEPSGNQFMSWPVLHYLVDALAGRWFVRRMLHDVYHDHSKVDDVLVDAYARENSAPQRGRTLALLGRHYFSEEHERMTQRYASLATPLLVVWGDHDRWLPRRFGRRLHDEVPGSRFETIERTGHLPHQERPEAVNPLLVDFLTGR